MPTDTEDKTPGRAVGGKKIVTATELQKEVNALKAIVTLHDEAISRMIFLLRSMKEGGPQVEVAKRAEKKAAG